jgi:NAD(P)-dependent dehydrogenase (short-subunit alcohol dehydrogenase family)
MRSRPSLSSEVVVVTGASAGVGRATAIAFGRRGACVGLVARGHAGLRAARRDVEAAGGRAIVCPADVADPQALRDVAARVEEAFGPIDIWINNAMTSVFAPGRETTPAEFRRVSDVTYLGVVHGTLAALERMQPRDRGVIVQVGSALAYRGIPLQSAYCAAKHAVQGFCESLRAELRHDGSHVRVTMVQLPAINTPQFEWVKSRLAGRGQPVPPIFQPEVAADAIVWATEHGRRELYVGWPTVWAILGNSVAPALGDWHSPGAATSGSRPASRSGRIARTICGRRSTRPATLAPTGASTIAPVRRAGICGSHSIAGRSPRPLSWRPVCWPQRPGAGRLLRRAADVDRRSLVQERRHLLPGRREVSGRQRRLTGLGCRRFPGSRRLPPVSPTQRRCQYAACYSTSAAGTGGAR